MSSNFFRIDGLPVAPAVAKDYLRWKAGHDKNCPCGVPLRITSGWRSKQDQHDIFVDRYRVGAKSPWGDYRTYQGKTWGRVSGKGTVMSPDDVSNHTLGYALDVNITQGGVCQRWNIANAPKYGFNWVEGKAVKEPWHWCWHVTFRPTKSTPDPWEGRGIPTAAPKSDPGMTRDELYASTTPDTTTTGEVIVKHHYFRDDGKAKRKGGIDLAPDTGTWLHTDAKIASSRATNVVGKPGEYSFVVHIYAEGTPGDVVNVVLAWDDTKTSGPHSMHFVERVEIGVDGTARRNAAFARAVGSGYAVYARAATPATNRDRVKVTRLAVDALLFGTV